MREREKNMTMTLENLTTLQTIVEEEVEWMFGDVVGTGQGIGTSDITACMNACVPAVNGRFEIDLGIMRGMINDALCALEEGVA